MNFDIESISNKLVEQQIEIDALKKICIELTAQQTETNDRILKILDVLDMHNKEVYK